MIESKFRTLYEDYNPVQDYNELWSFISEKLNILKPKIIGEIGTEFGGSSLIWSTIAKENNGIFVGIDTEVSNAKKVVKNALPKFKSYWFQGKSQDIEIVTKVTGFLNDKNLLFDFLFIDGAHDVNSVLQDCKNYIPLVRSGGIVAFHDAGDVNGGPINGINKSKQQGIIKFTEEGLYNNRMGIYWFTKE